MPSPKIKRHDSHSCHTTCQKEKCASPGTQHSGNGYIETKKKRPQQVVLQFDSQKPEMGKRRLIGHSGKIISIFADLPPVIVSQHHRYHFHPDGFDHIRRQDGIYPYSQ